MHKNAFMLASREYYSLTARTSQILLSEII